MSRRRLVRVAVVLLVAGGVAPAAVTVAGRAGPGEKPPFAFGDLNDNDNVVDLCLEQVVEPPVRVEVDAGVVVDPRDGLNPATAVDLR